MKRNIKFLLLSLFVLILFCSSVNCFGKYTLADESRLEVTSYIDTLAPIIEGVEENGRYNHDRSISFSDDTGILSAIYYHNSETSDFSNIEAATLENNMILTDEGYYKIVVEDLAHNITTISDFLIDKTPPQIKGVQNGVIYDLPPNLEYYDKYGIEKIEITTEEELTLNYQYKNSNNRPCSDRTNHSLTIHVSYTPKDVIEYKWYIKKAEDIEYKLFATNLEKDFTFTNLDPSTTYNIYCMATTSTQKSYMSNPISALTLTNYKIEIINITDTSYQIKITGIDDGTQNFNFPTWTEANGQDDIIWYGAAVQNQECIFTVDYRNHNKEKGKYNTHIYQAGGSYIQSTYVYLGQEEPKTESQSEFLGNTEITVTDKTGNQTNINYYVDTTITLTQSMDHGKQAYTKLKEILQGKMESCDDNTYTIKVKRYQLDHIKKLEIKNYTSISGKGFRDLNYFKKLEYLDLSGSNPFYEETLSTLSNLTYLDISHSTGSYDLSFLNSLPKLEYLNTEGTTVVNEQYVENLPNLKEWKH